MAEMTLQNVTMELQRLNILQEETYITQSKTKESVDGLRDDFAKLFGLFEKQMRMAAEEKREGDKKKTAGKKPSPSEKKEDGGFGFLTIMLGGVVAAASFFIQAFKDYFTNVTKLFKGVFNSVSKMIKFIGKETGISKAIGRLFDTIDSTLDALRANLADKLKPLRNSISRIFKNINTVLTDTFKPLSDSISRIFKNINTVLTDVFKPIGESIGKFFGRIRTFFTEGNNIQRFFSNITTSIRNFGTNFSKGFGGVNKQALGMFDDILKVGDFSTLAGKIGAGFRNVTDFFTGSLFSADGLKDMKTIGGAIAERLSGIIDPIKNFFGGEGPIARIANYLRGSFKFLQAGSPVMGMFATVGRFLGRLVWPITVLFGIIDGIGGFISEYKDSGSIVSGILGGISEVLVGIIGMPLDLLKSAVSWILGKMGFEQAEKLLDSFNFSDLIRNIIMSPIVMLKRAFNGILELIASAVEAFDIPFVDEKKAANTIRGFKFEDTGESKTEQRARKKEEKQEAQFEAEKGDDRYQEGVFKSKKQAQAAAMKMGYSKNQASLASEKQDDGTYRILKKGAKVGKKAREEYQLKKKQEEELTTPPPKQEPKKKAPQQAQSFEEMSEDYSPPPPVVVVNNREGDTNASSNTTLAGETRPSTVNDRVGSTGFVGGVY